MGELCFPLPRRLVRSQINTHLPLLWLYCLYGVLSGTKQTPEGEKKGEKVGEKGQTRLGTRKQRMAVWAEGLPVFLQRGLFPTRVAAPWPCAGLGGSCLPVTSNYGAQS